MLPRVACFIATLSLSNVALADEPMAPPAEPPLDIPSGMTLGFSVGGAFATAGIAGIVATLHAFPEGERGMTIASRSRWGSAS